MTIENQNATIYDGESRQLVITVKNGTTPVDITGASIKWVAVSDDHMVMKTTDDDIVLTSPVDGQFTVELRSADTSGHPGVYQHESRVTLQDGTVASTTRGKITVKRSLFAIHNAD